MKPDWLKCEKCLWWMQSIGSHKYSSTRKIEYGKCRFNNLPKEQLYSERDCCSNWTCANCWKSWDNEILNLTIDEDVYTDHSKCQEVKFK